MAMSPEDDLLRRLKQQVEDSISALRNDKVLIFEKGKQALEDAKNARQVEEQKLLGRLREIKAASSADCRKREDLELDYLRSEGELTRLRNVWLARLEASTPAGPPATSTAQPTPASPSSGFTQQAPAENIAQKQSLQVSDGLEFASQSAISTASSVEVASQPMNLAAGSIQQNIRSRPAPGSTATSRKRARGAGDDGKDARNKRRAGDRRTNDEHESILNDLSAIPVFEELFELLGDSHGKGGARYLREGVGLPATVVRAIYRGRRAIAL
ncbi:hypothetical protein B0T14DRAFT_569708 [Immersiella caudata]|uniref:Uncharacterized protein n=1 Tax=Immersiella caudata TaxID=314043 RepID=A0AA39WE18_9PEZI|nr:hypothetical protein B0T14DRAFT_569708 [Immersiella caudata]